MPSVRMNCASESSRDQLAALGPHRLGADPGQQQARQAAIGELVPSRSAQSQPEGTVYSLVLVPVSGVGARQAAQRQQPCHEPQISVRFAGPDKLVHLIEAGEVAPRLGWRLPERRYRPVQAGEDFSSGNQVIPFTPYSLSFSHAPPTRQAKRKH